MRHLNNNGLSSFTLSSNNKKIKFIPKQTIPIECRKQNLINFLSFINYKKESNKEISYKENLKSLIFQISKNTLYHFEHNAKNNNKESINDNTKRSYEPIPSSLDLNDIIKYKYFLNQTTNEICFFILTKQQIYYGILINKNKEESNKSNLIFDISQNHNITIKDFFLPENNNDSTFLYILLSNNMIIQFNYAQKTQESNDLINQFLKNEKENLSSKKKNQEENEEIMNNLKIIEFEYYKDSKIAFAYLLYKNESYLSLLTFSQIKEEEEEIHYFSVYKNQYLILVLSRGKVILISLENYKILSIYKSNFGLITSISFSNDGNLLGLGAQDNNAYIIDLNNRNIISCLEGHGNYISKMIFELQEDNNKNNYLYSKDEQINVNLVRNKKNIFQKTNKEFILEKWGNSLKEQINDKKIKYRKMSTVKIPNNNSFKIYDIFTCGLDGKIGSYRIEYYENNCLENKSEIKSITQENNTDNISSKIMTNKNINNNNNQNTKKLYYLNKLIMLNPPENDEYDKSHFIFMNNIINEPIIDFFKNDLLFVIASKVNILGSEIKLIFFECEEKIENNSNESNSSYYKSRNSMNKTSNASIASDLEELNNLRVKIKIPK